jgi:hypothetical protein
MEKALGAARAKGWVATVGNSDQESYRYGSIEVSRAFGIDRVTGTFEFDISEGVKTQRLKTSFYDHGLASLHEAMMDAIGTLGWIAPKTKATKPTATASDPPLIPILHGMLRRFDRYARQLTRRHGDRAGITISDEYDVQDILHALLRSLTNDVRAEEVAPSYAGASSRLDFLLKKEQIVIEVKLASEKLRDKDVGEQLIVDIKRYAAHPDCKSLLCLVYDPGNRIKNPQGLESDLTGKHGDLDVSVLVVPH